MDLFARFARRDPPPPAPIDPSVIREELRRTDPDYQHVREVYHDARNALAARQGAGQLRDRFNERLRDSWRHHP